MKAKTAFVIGALAAGYIVKRVWKKRFAEEQARGDEEERSKQLYYHWILLSQKGVSLAEALRDMGAEKTAVLGMNETGRRLIDELMAGGIEVPYAIESDDPSAVHESLDVLRLGDDPLPEVDAVIICAAKDQGAVRDALKRETGAKVMTIGELIAGAVAARGLMPRDGAMRLLEP